MIEGGVPIILYNKLKEWGNGAAHRGTPLPQLQGQLSSMPDIDMSLLNPDYHKENDRGSRRIKALILRDDLVDFTDAAREGGEWKGLPIAKVEDGKDIHLLVISHGNIMSSLVNNSKVFCK